jgi:type II secretory pathway component PulJ
MNRNSRSGFTIIELLIFSAIFALVTISFLSVLVAVVRVQSRQGASTDVNQQSDFVLATVQRLVEQSSQIEGTANTAVTDITLRMASSSQDPSRLYLSNLEAISNITRA